MATLTMTKSTGHAIRLNCTQPKGNPPQLHTTHTVATNLEAILTNCTQSTLSVEQGLRAPTIALHQALSTKNAASSPPLRDLACEGNGLPIRWQATVAFPNRVPNAQN